MTYPLAFMRARAEELRAEVAPYLLALLLLSGCLAPPLSRPAADLPAPPTATATPSSVATPTATAPPLVVLRVGTPPRRMADEWIDATVREVETAHLLCAILLTHEAWGDGTSWYPAHMACVRK